MSELKPCPFCETSLEFFGHDIRNGKKVEVHRHPTPENPTWDECPLSGLIFDVERWNKRPLEDALQQKYDTLLSEVKAAMEEIWIRVDGQEYSEYDRGMDCGLAILRKHIKEVE